MKKLFLDSSVLFTAVNSPIGASAKLFTLKNTQLIVSQLVLTEVERNVRKKLLDYHLKRFFVLADKLKIINLSINYSLAKKAGKIIVKKDVFILCQAKQSKADYLITLDKKHFLKEEVRQFIRPTLILTPKEFLKRYLSSS